MEEIERNIFLFSVFGRPPFYIRLLVVYNELTEKVKALSRSSNQLALTVMSVGTGSDFYTLHTTWSQ